MRPLRLSRSQPLSRIFCISMLLFLAGSPLSAKTAIDFNPNLDFSKYKTFTFIGGVEHLTMFQVDPQLMFDRIHKAVQQGLTDKGLREVELSQHPDLVVRYWANPPSQVNVATMGTWSPYRPYIDSYWSWIYNDVSNTSAKEGSLIIDLIDPRSRDLAWRVYLMRKISTPDKEWKKAAEELAKAFEAYPPSAADKEGKKKERTDHPGSASD
jgi:Domain of unknown function (DUF4136)